MYDLTTMRVVASDRRAGAQHAADLHRQRVALRADARSMLAATLQRLAMRLDARTGQATEAPSSSLGAFPASTGLRSAA